MIKDLVKKNRSYRKFYQDKKIAFDTLVDLVALTRYIASGRNLQPLKYYISNDEKLNEAIFKSLVWAGYLSNWNGPEKGEQPSAYILICEDSTISTDANFDVGIAAQTILMAAVENGMGGCMLLSFNKIDLVYLLHLEENIKPVMVLALGFPNEEIIVDDLNEDESVKYWRDAFGVHHVPKRKLNDIIITRYNILSNPSETSEFYLNKMAVDLINETVRKK